MNKIILTRIVLSIVLISMCVPLFIGCQNPSAQNETVPENKVELPEGYRKIIGKWENTIKEDNLKEVEFTKTHIIDYWTDKEADYINLDIPKLKINGNKIESNYETILILDNNKIKLLPSERILIRKTDNSSEEGTTPDNTSIDTSKFYGSWTYTNKNMFNKKGTLTFNANGTFSYLGDFGAGKTASDTTYTIKGNIINIKFNLQGHPVDEKFTIEQGFNTIKFISNNGTQGSTTFQAFFAERMAPSLTLNRAY